MLFCFAKTKKSQELIALKTILTSTIYQKSNKENVKVVSSHQSFENQAPLCHDDDSVHGSDRLWKHLWKCSCLSLLLTSRNAIDSRKHLYWQNFCLTFLKHGFFGGVKFTQAMLLLGLYGTSVSQKRTLKY